MKDIITAKILVNDFGAFSNIGSNALRPTLRRDGQIVYGIINFDIFMISHPLLHEKNVDFTATCHGMVE